MCNFIMSTVLFFVILLFQTMAFLGFTVISFGISLVGVLILKIRSEHEGINVTVWAIGGLVVLSHVSEGIFYGYRKSGIKAWIDQKKRRAPNLLEKVPLFLYFVIFCAAVSQCYFQHPLHNELKHIPKGSPRVDASTQVRFSMIFLLCMAYIAYIAAGSSDWVVHISRPDIVREKLSFRSLLACIVCVDLEILSTFMNVFLLAFYSIPIILEFYGIATHYIFLSGLAATIIAILLKVDQACPQFQCGKTPYPAELKLFARSFVLQHIWYPLLIVWFMKKSKVVILSYELSDRQDFAIYVSILSITIFKAVRNITVILPSLAVRDNRIATEPMGGGDNGLAKIPPPSPTTPTLETEYSGSDSFIGSNSGEDESSGRINNEKKKINMAKSNKNKRTHNYYSSDSRGSYPIRADKKNNNWKKKNAKMSGKNKIADTEVDYSSGDSRGSYYVRADKENNKNKNANTTKMSSKNKMVLDDADDISAVHLPSAPTFEEINEVRPTTWTSRPARKWPGNDFMGSNGYAGYSDMV